MQLKSLVAEMVEEDMHTVNVTSAATSGAALRGNSNEMYKQIDDCRMCYGRKLTMVLDLGMQALTGVFPKSKNEGVSWSASTRQV